MTTEWPVLHQAAWDNDTLKIQKLVDGGANVNAPLNDGLTPLHIAAHQGHADSIDLLLRCGARFSPRLPTGATPMYITALGGKKEAVETFIKHYPQSKQLPSDLLYAAASGGHHEIVEMLLNTGRIAVNGKVEDTTAVWVAAQQGHVRVVDALVLAGADVDEPSPDGRTPLYVASYRGHADVVRRLLLAQANPFKENGDGSTPMHIACYENHEQVVRVFCERGIDMLLPSSNQRTVSPYQLALFKRKTRLAQIIKFAYLWPKVRLLWIASRKCRRPEDMRSSRDNLRCSNAMCIVDPECPASSLPRDMVRFISSIVLSSDLDAVAGPHMLPASPTPARIECERAL